MADLGGRRPGTGCTERIRAGSRAGGERSGVDLPGWFRGDGTCGRRQSRRTASWWTRGSGRALHDGTEALVPPGVLAGGYEESDLGGVPKRLVVAGRCANVAERQAVLDECGASVVTVDTPAQHHGVLANG